MYDVLTKSIMSLDEFDKIQKGKSASAGFDRKIVVDAKFLKDLQEADIQKNSYLDDSTNILILHGTEDEVVPFEAVSKFADDNIIEFIPVAGADHRFQHPSAMEISTKEIIRFLGLA